MSFAKAKLPRNEIKDIPKIFSNGSSNSKSYIPKIRSVSQPSTARSSQDNLRSRSCSDQMKIGHTIRNESLPPSLGSPRDRSKSQSIKSEEFRDALSTKLSESALELSEANFIDTHDTSFLAKKSSISAIPVPVKLCSNPSKSSFRSKMPLRINSGFGGRLSSPSSPERRGFDSANKRSMELQFINKKKRFENMKREFLEKQKPVVEMYQTLVHLKKKLEENGKIVTLESIKILDCDKSDKILLQKNVIKEQALDTSGGGERFERKVDFRTKDYEELHQVLKNIPACLLTVCKQTAERRKHILSTYESSFNSDDMDDAIKEQIIKLRKETTDLDNQIEKIFGEQDETVNQTIENWHKLYADAKNCSNSDNVTIKQLENKMKDMEQSIKNYEDQLHSNNEQKSVCETCKDLNKLEEENKQLKEHLKSFEKKLEHEKVERRKLQDEHFKLKDTDQSLKNTRYKYKELEMEKQKFECKVVHLSSELQKAKSQVKQHEQKHEKYRSDIEKQIRLDEGVVDKLNKSKNVMETRLEFLQDQMDQQKRNFQKRETALLQELEEVRTESQLQYKTKQNIQQKLEYMTRAKSSLEMARQATVDLINNKKTAELLHNKDLKQIAGDSFTTDLERHLYTEKVVLESELKATQEKVEAFTNEKMRFIETMQTLNSNDVDNLKKELIERDQTIFQLETQIKKDANTNEQQKIVIDEANNEINNLKQRIELETSTLPTDEEEVRKVLVEGKLKLEHAMKKTLGNEQKIVKYESELAKQSALLVELENLLKVRDGLIGMMKQKKDDLLFENSSLTKYSNGVRDAIFEAHEALSEKTVEVKKMREALHEKSQYCQRLEKRVHELEVLITAANDKRFKLQDTIGCIEKELQSTKAHLEAAVSHPDRVNQIRYEPGTTSSNNTTPCRHIVRPIPFFRRSADQLFGNNNPCRYQHPLTRRSIIFRHRPQSVQRANNINSTFVVNRGYSQNALRKNRAIYNYAPQQLNKNRAGPSATEKEVQIQPTTIGDSPDISKDCSESEKTSDESEQSNSEIVQKVKTTITSSTHIRKLGKRTPSIYPSSLRIREQRREKFISALRKNAERFQQRNEQKRFIENVQKLSKYDQLSADNREYLNSASLLFDGYNKYKVLKSGSLVWCKPTRDLHVSSMMITKNLIAESCHKIKKDIESSLQLLETSCANLP